MAYQLGRKRDAHALAYVRGVAVIFRPELAKQVRMGKKTQTRRPVKASDTDEFGITKCRYVAGKSYSIQAGRGKPSSGRLTVLDVRREPVGLIDLADAKREGFKTTTEFKDYWAELYGSFDPDTEVWVISFRLGDWTQKGQLRLLAASPGPPGGDYTTEPKLALRGEGEAIEESLQAEYSRDGRERDAEREAERRGQETAAQRVARLAVEAGDSRGHAGRVVGGLLALERYVERVENEVGIN